ncbi:MAG: Rpn family recombination-promoting nuclease/putative transposase [Gammaproteobacteria bacterium]
MNKQLPTPHDRFFRSTMTHPTVIREFFTEHLPAHIKKTLDFNSIKPLKDSFVNDKLRLQITDLLYSASFNNRPGYLYLLVEHQSTPNQLMPFRLLKYTIDIIDQHLTKHGGTKLPVVYPMVFYNGQKPYKYSTDLFDLFEEDKDLALKIFWKPFDLIDLTQIPDERFKDHLMFGVAAKVMKHIYDKDFLLFFKILIQELRRLESLGEDKYIYTVLSYIAQASESSKEKFIEITRTGLVDPNEEKIMTIAEQFRQEGVQVGQEKAFQAVATELRRTGLSSKEVEKVINLSKNLVNKTNKRS